MSENPMIALREKLQNGEKIQNPGSRYKVQISSTKIVIFDTTTDEYLIANFYHGDGPLQLNFETPIEIDRSVPGDPLNHLKPREIKWLTKDEYLEGLRVSGAGYD